MNDRHLNRAKRDGTADLLKGLAVLFMIQVHLMEQFVSRDTFNSIIGKTSMFLGGPPCAPVFLAVMGYFLAFSEKPFSYFLKRGILLFFGGILLNAARSANLLIHIMCGEVHLDPWFFIMGADILTLAGLSLVLTGCTRMIFKNNASFYALTALVVAAISPWLNRFSLGEKIPGHIIAFLWGTADWSYFPIFPWFAYVLVGFAFRLFVIKSTFVNKIKIQDHFIYFVPLWIGIIITIPYASAFTYNLDGPGGYYHHGILFFCWVILFLLSYLVLVNLMEATSGDKMVAGMIKWIGQKVTTLYVIQWLIIGNLATWLYRSQDLFQFLVWFVVVTAATLLTGKLVEKIREGLQV